MAKIKVILMSPAARGRFGVKKGEVIEVEEKNMQGYLQSGIARIVTADGTPAKKRGRPPSKKAERAVKRPKAETADG